MPPKAVNHQSVVIAQCYYDFRHQVDSVIAKGPERKALPLPSVLRIPTTNTVTTTYKGAAAVAALARHGLHQNVHSRLTTTTVISSDQHKSSGPQKDGEERILRHTKNSVTIRRQEPIGIKGEHILLHALGSLFFNSWRLYRSSVFEVNASDGSAPEVDPLVNEMAERADALERLEPKGASKEPSHPGNNILYKAFEPQKSPKEAAEHIAQLTASFEDAQMARQRRLAKEARRSSAGGKGSATSITADETSQPERDTIQTLLMLIDNVDVGAMADAASGADITSQEPGSSKQPPCPLVPFSALFDPIFFQMQEEGAQSSHQPLQVLPTFLLDLMSDSAQSARESASPYAEVRILSEVIRQFDAHTRRAATAASSSSFASAGHQHMAGEADQTSNVDQLRRVHERLLESQQEEEVYNSGVTTNGRGRPGLLVSLLSEPAQWYRYLDKAVEAFIEQYQYGLEDEDDTEAAMNRTPLEARAVARSQHFADPTSTYYYTMCAKKAILRSLCLSMLTYFDAKVGDTGATQPDKKALLPSRYKEDYTVFISKPDGTLLPSWEEFCEDCGVPTQVQDAEADEGEQSQRDGDDDPALLSAKPRRVGPDPLQRAFEESVYRFEALNDSRLVSGYLCPKLQSRIVTPDCLLPSHPLAQQTHQYKELSEMHPLRQLGPRRPAHTAEDYIPLTFTIAFTPRHPATTGLHVAAKTVRHLANSPTALFVHRSPLLWVPNALVVLGASARLNQKHSMGAARAQAMAKEVAHVYGDLSAGVAKQLLKAVSVCTVNDLSSVRAAPAMRTVVSSYIAISSTGVTVSMGPKGGEEEDAEIDEASAALALQLLTQEDGHNNVGISCTAGLVEDRLAAHRGVSRLDFLPSMQLPYPFLASMRLAEFAEAEKFLFLSSVAAGEQRASRSQGQYAVQWDAAAEDDALAHAAASLYGDDVDVQPPHRQPRDARDILAAFTAPPASERLVSDIITLPTILVPERAGRAKDQADAFVARSLEGSRPAASRASGADEFIVCGYNALVQQQLLDKSTDTIVQSSSHARPSVVPYDGKGDDLAALAGTVSLAALWEEAGMSACDLAMYGAGRVGSIALSLPGGHSHGSAQTISGRAMDATAPVGGGEGSAHADPSCLGSYQTPINVLAKQAARVCQRLGPSYIAMELERQRTENVSAMAADWAAEEELVIQSHAKKVAQVAKGILAQQESGTGSTNLADALMSEPTVKLMPQRMAHGKAQFDHLVRVGRKRLAEEEIAEEYASQSVILPAVLSSNDTPVGGLAAVRNRLNQSAPIIGRTAIALTAEERRAVQEQQLARRLEARDMSRSMNLAQNGGAALEALIDPSNRMSLFVMKTLRPELRKLNAEDRQLLEEKSLVTSLGATCQTEKDEHTYHLDRSRDSRNKTRDVTAEVADTIAIEHSLMDRKWKGRQLDRVRDGALSGDLQRLLVDRSAAVQSMTSPSPVSAPTLSDNRLLGFEHLMSRNRSATYNL